MAMAALFATTVQAQQYDTLPYNLGVPQFLTEHPLDSMHIIYEGGVTKSYPYLYPMCITQDYTEWPTHVYNNFDTGDYAFGFHFDTALTVIGIAWLDVAAFVSDYDNGLRSFDSVEVKLYTPEGGEMIPFASKRGRFDTMVVSRMYAPWRGWGQSDADFWEAYFCASGNHVTYCYPLIEVYFDGEFNVTDSFYMSVKYWDTYLSLNRVAKTDMVRGWAEFLLNQYEIRHFPAQSYIMKRDASSAWQYGEIPCYPLLFPIVRRACDTCPEVQGLRWSRLGSGTTVFVQWDAGVNHRDWQLSYGPTGTPAGEGTVVDCPIAQSVLSGMAAGHPYDIYVRARCRFARDEWTGWSGPLEVGFSSPGEGIEGAATDIAAELTPNPATGRVKVACAEAMRKVEVYDLQGRRCLAQEAQGTETELDISALAAGRYTVLLHTATATAAKALVVQ